MVSANRNFVAVAILVVLIIAYKTWTTGKTADESCEYGTCSSEGESKCEVLEIYECKDGCWSYVDVCSYDCIGEGHCILTTIPPS